MHKYWEKGHGIGSCCLVNQCGRVEWLTKTESSSMKSVEANEVH